MARIRLSTSPTPLRPSSVLSKVDDSPSRQLLLDLERALCQFQIHEVELQKVHAHDCRLFQENLECLDTKQAEDDLAALEAATYRHENVRKEAEAELHHHYQEVEERQRLEKQKLEEQRLKEEQDRKEAEARRRAKDEAETRARVEKEAAAKRAADEVADRKKQEAVAREQAETARKEREYQEAARAAQRAAYEKAAREKEAQEAAKAEQIKQSQKEASRPGRLAENVQHRRYLDIHQKLKRFRREFWAECKKDASLKSKVGDMRRGIKISVGQLTETKGANKQPTERIRSILKDTITISTPPIDMRDYFATMPTACQTAEQSQCPSMLVYMLSIFSKAIISQFGSESGISIKAAEPAGVLVAHIFATTEFQLQGHSLIDILLAKLHFVCPVLWGVYGDEKTAEGRQLLGWRREDGQFVSESRQHERVSGFGAGFASITLRNFSKSRLQNPLPPTHFWESLANIANVPPGDVQPTHLLVLKAMLENSVERLIQFFGSAALAVLRHALIEFPASLPPKLRETAPSQSMMLLADRLAREKNLGLDIVQRCLSRTSQPI